MDAIGIDIGGTRTRVGVVSLDGSVLVFEKFGTGSDFATLRASITRAITSAAQGARLDLNRAGLIGLAVPGVRDPLSQKMQRVANLPFLTGCDPRELLGDFNDGTARVVSDAMAATWGEFVTITPRARAFGHLRLGTGAACAIVCDSRFQQLDRTSDRHLDILRSTGEGGGAECRCGARGCLEATASRAAILLRMRSERLGSTLGELRDAVAAGNPDATLVFESVAAAVSEVATRLVVQFNLDVLSIGGGVVAELPELFEAVAAAMGVAGRSKIQPAKLGDRAGVVGAALLAHKAS